MKVWNHLKKVRLLNKNLGLIFQGFLFIIFLFPITLMADGGFSFSTEIQSIAISELSGAITIHSDSPVSETTYITLTSTSNTGQFFSSKTSTESITSGSYIYISSGNSNRTFYYKDASSGTFVLTANIFNKEKDAKLATITQNINIGVSSGGNSTSTTTEVVETEWGGTKSSNSSSSAHSSPFPLSNTENKIDFEISAGRDRLTSVGNKILFITKATRSQNMDDKNIVYEWSFGDGTLSKGNIVDHTYKFAGEYSVVVNGYYSDKQAVSRIKVLVIEPKLSLSRVSGGLEILNNSGSEINLEGWRFLGQTKSFVFPKDTLLPNNKKIVFSDEITGINNGHVVLENPAGKKYAEINEENNIVLGAFIDTETILKEIEKVKVDLEKISPQIEINTDQTNMENVQSKISFEKTKQILDVSAQIDLETEDIIFEAPRSKSLINSFLSWPISGFEKVRGWFVEK